MLALWSSTSFGYRFLVLLHITAAIIGFGSSFIWPVLATKARRYDPPTGHAINMVSDETSKWFTTYMIFATTIVGVVLVAVSSPWKFSQTWVWLALVLNIVAILIAEVLHYPNLQAMLAAEGRLAAGSTTPGPDGTSAEALEIEEREKNAAMYGGILHFMFLLIMIDMIWKPGL